MTHTYAALTLTLSLLPLIALALRDPKRLRSRRSARRGASRAERRVFAMASLVPGVLLAAVGQWPAFLIWLGGIAIAGWLLALSLAGTRSGHATAS
jgi:hypothetical protein